MGLFFLPRDGGLNYDSFLEENFEHRYSPETGGMSIFIFVVTLFALTFVVNAMPGAEGEIPADIFRSMV